MKRRVLPAILSAFLLFFITSSLWAVQPTDEVIQRLKDEGLFDNYIQSMNAARAKGVDTPTGDDGKGSTKFNLSPNQTMKVLVILVDFPNMSYTSGWAAGTAPDFDSLLFSDGLNPTGSMKEFYIKNSYGNLVLEGDVVGWYKAANTSDYYTNFCDGSRGMGPYPNNAQRLVEEAIDMADPNVDFSQYDNDGNGYVDGIFVVHAGAGYEETGNVCQIHSHQWSISPRFKDGVYVRTYSIEPEESAGSQGLIPIGVFCHEFGHVLGLPDIYDTDYSSSGAGKWALMAGGSYNGQSRSPSNFIGWSKMHLGWLSPINITSNQTDVEIPAIELNPVAYRLWRNGQSGNQYFFVENRQGYGTDASLPGSGILIWHIDDNVNGNTNDWHPQVFLEQADGKFDLQYDNNSGDAGDIYPAGGQYTQFHDKTTPGSRDYSNQATQVAVWNISPSDSVMTADFDISWSRPWLYLTSYSFSDAVGGDGDGLLEAGETIELRFTVNNDWKAISTTYIDMTVDDATLAVQTGSISLGSIGTNGSVNNNTNPLIFQIPTDYASRIDTFFLTVEADGGEFVSVLPIEQNVGSPVALLIDDDANDNLESYYSSPLYTKRMPYDRWDIVTSGLPSLALLNKYEVVVWFTGDFRSDPLTLSETALMQSYLDGGGNLFLTGQGIAKQLSGSDPGFLNNYLRANYLSTSLVPVLSPDSSSTPFGDLGNIVIAGSGSAGNQTKPDHISAVNGSLPEIHYYGSPDLAAVSYSGSYKLMFFSFGFEAIVANDYRFAERDTVFNRVLEFFGVSPTAGYPEVNDIVIGPGEMQHLTIQTPDISWPYFDAGGNPQQQYHVQVGTDNEWSSAEMWNYGPISGTDTSVTYAGNALVDGQSYYVRVQVFNGIQWSNWQVRQFHMNSIPSVPGGLSPANLTGVASATPLLEHQNALDNELDDLAYDYEVYADSQMTILVAQADNQPGSEGKSSWTVTTSLGENDVYYWRVRASDGYEQGGWSGAASFWVNAEDQLPAVFSLITPPDGQVLTEPLVSFEWTHSSDADLYDAVSYRLLLALTESFSDADTVTTGDSAYTKPDSLAYGHIYYWKVQAEDLFGGITTSPVFSFSTLILGDANGDGRADVGDVVFVINYVFKGGAAPDPLSSGDANGDCAVNVGDAVYMIGYIFKGGPPPLAGDCK